MDHKGGAMERTEQRGGERVKSYPYVILGGGVVAGYAARAFVENGLQSAELCILSAEPHLPYERPLLSKGFLPDPHILPELLINAPAFYAEHGITVRLSAPVDRVDFEQKQLYLQDEIIGYDKLLLATGARPRHLPVPGAELAGIYYLRHLADAAQIHAAASTAKQAVVIGGGFLGMEVTGALQRLGLATTLVFPEPHLCERLFTTRMAAFFEDYYRRCGVTILRQEKVIGFASDNGHVTHVSLASGKDLATDLVVAGVGILPNIELFANTALGLDDGIVINRYLETNLPNIYAAGDVACYRDLLYDRLRRVDHWENAVTQGRLAAHMMLGRREAYVHVPYIFSRFFDLAYEFWGDTTNAERVIYRGDVDSGSFSVWWLSPTGRLLAAFILNRPAEERQWAQEWLQQRVQVDADRLHDVHQPLCTAVERLGAEL